MKLFDPTTDRIPYCTFCHQRIMDSFSDPRKSNWVYIYEEIHKSVAPKTLMYHSAKYKYFCNEDHRAAYFYDNV